MSLGADIPSQSLGALAVIGTFVPAIWSPLVPNPPWFTTAVSSLYGKVIESGVAGMIVGILVRTCPPWVGGP